MSTPTLRIQEGALSPRKTPSEPPADTKLVPIAQAVAANQQKDGKA